MHTINFQKNYFLLLLIPSIFFILMSANLSAATQISPIICKTNYGEKSFVIEKDSIAMINNSNKDNKREISSNLEARVRVTSKGLERIMYIGRLKYKIHIDDLKNYSEFKDYLSISDDNGHEMTYPINCINS